MSQPHSRLLAALQVSENQAKQNNKPQSTQELGATALGSLAQSIQAQQPKPAGESAQPPKTQLTPAYLQSLEKNGLDKAKQTSPSSHATQDTSADKKISRVDISVAGTSHRIGCPSDKVQTLRQNTQILNQKLKELRVQVSGKPLTNEELLVLHCLALYDELAVLKDAQEKTHAIADKLLGEVKALG